MVAEVKAYVLANPGTVSFRARSNSPSAHDLWRKNAALCRAACESVFPFSLSRTLCDLSLLCHRIQVMAYRCAGTNENGPNKGRRDCKAFRISPDLTPILNSKNKPSLHVVRVGKTTVTCGSFSCPVALAADGVTIVFDPAAKQRKK